MLISSKLGQNSTGLDADGAVAAPAGLFSLWGCCIHHNPGPRSGHNRSANVGGGSRLMVFRAPPRLCRGLAAWTIKEGAGEVPSEPPKIERSVQKPSAATGSAT